jgi:hypothetical protein
MFTCSAPSSIVTSFTGGVIMSASILGENWQGRLRALKPGWDSYNGEPISEAAICAVEMFAVVPCSDGGLILQAKGVEIEIGPDGTVEHEEHKG